jgi:adenosylcobinamide-GDP ribazoletransferase
MTNPNPSSTNFFTPFTDFMVAMQFLTVIPPVIKRLFTPQEMGRSVAYFPLVGLVIGGVLVVARRLFALFLPPLPVAALLLAVWVLSSGALHVDGFLDSLDGLLGGFTPESRLSILRDEHKGAFAVAGGILLFLIKFSAVVSLAGWRAPALLLAPMFGRWTISLAIVFFPYARPEGLGKVMKDHAGRVQAGLATAFMLLAAWLAAGFYGLAACAVALLVGLLVVWFTIRRIPGLTGDIYGALCELVETAVLLLFCVTQ